MNAETLVAILEQDGVRLRADGEKLKLQAPADKVPHPERVAELRENKAAILEYLRARKQPPEIQFVSLQVPIHQQTDKRDTVQAVREANASKMPVRCDSPHCAGCYEVTPGVRIHPPKSGEDYRAWLERWEAKGSVQ